MNSLILCSFVIMTERYNPSSCTFTLRYVCTTYRKRHRSNVCATSETYISKMFLKNNFRMKFCLKLNFKIYLNKNVFNIRKFLHAIPGFHQRATSVVRNGQIWTSQVSSGNALQQCHNLHYQ